MTTVPERGLGRDPFEELFPTQNPRPEISAEPPEAKPQKEQRARRRVKKPQTPQASEGKRPAPAAEPQSDEAREREPNADEQLEALRLELRAAQDAAESWKTRALDLERAPLLRAAELAAAPPPADGPMELLGLRIPADMRDDLREITQQLRRRGGTAVSQKRLPEQEVLAMALWLLGSPEDAEAMKQVGQLHDRFRRRRLVAELEASEEQ